MYDLKSLKRKIEKEGLQETIDFLLSDSLDERVKSDLTKCHVFNENGYLCLSLVCYL